MALRLPRLELELSFWKQSRGHRPGSRSRWSDRRPRVDRWLIVSLSWGPVVT